MGGCEHPLFLLYTSGSTGKPKGIQHSSAGYLLNAKTSVRWAFDLNATDVFWCTADVGWVTGHTYVVYGPLAPAQPSSCTRERRPSRRRALLEDLPNARRHHLYTAPTAIRALMNWAMPFRPSTICASYAFGYRG